MQASSCLTTVAASAGHQGSPPSSWGGPMKARSLLALLLTLGLLASGCSDDGGSTAGDGTWPDSITFGFVPSSEQEALQDNIQPFMDVLSETLGIEVNGVVTTDYTGLVTAMGTGKADLGAFGPFGYTLAQRQFGNMEVLIQAIRYGSATYHGQWMTNDPSLCETAPESGTALENMDEGVVQVGALEAVALQVGVYFGDSGKALGESVDAGDVSPGTSCMADLSKVKGKRVAFTSESSTSGYLFPALQLIEAGIDPVNDITPIFTGGHDGAVIAVYNGDADVGVSYDDARRTLRKEKTDVGDKVIVFNLTAEVPNDVVAASSLLPDSLQNAIYDAIYAYLETDEGEAVFDEAYGWTSIRRAVESDFDVVRKAADALGITEPLG
ncbi:MAG: hypothetical protein CL468_08125 [Acidimicrobiaceae bacterium]|nr:hypothetical protein [Acidimicrobiaceae bacterium]